MVAPIWGTQKLAFVQKTEKLSVDDSLPLPLHLKFRHGNELVCKLFCELYQRGIVDHQGILRRKIEPLSLEKKEISVLHEMLFSPFDFEIGDKIIQVSMGKLLQNLLTLPMEKRNLAFGHVEIIGSFVSYFFFVKCPTYIERLFGSIGIKDLYSVELLEQMHVLPIDCDIEAKIFQNNLADFNRLREMIIRDLALGFKEFFSSEEAYNRILSEGFDKQKLVRSISLQMQILKLKGSFFELKFSSQKPREYVFVLEDLSLPIKDILLKGEIETVTPRSRGDKGVQAIFDHLLGIVRAESSGTIDGKGALRAVSHTIRAKSIGTRDLTKLLLDKWLDSSNNVIEEIAQWCSNHHSVSSMERFCFFLSLAVLLKKKYSDEQIQIMLKQLIGSEIENLHPCLKSFALLVISEPFSVVYATVYCALFHRIARDEFAKGQTLAWIDHEEFTNPIIKVKIVNEKSITTLHFSGTFQTQMQILIEFAQKNPQKWIEIKDQLFALFLTWGPKALFSPFSSSFMEKRNALHLKSIQVDYPFSGFLGFLTLLVENGGSSNREEILRSSILEIPHLISHLGPDALPLLEQMDQQFNLKQTFSKLIDVKNVEQEMMWILVRECLLFPKEALYFWKKWLDNPDIEQKKKLDFAADVLSFLCKQDPKGAYTFFYEFKERKLHLERFSHWIDITLEMGWAQVFIGLLNEKLPIEKKNRDLPIKNILQSKMNEKDIKTVNEILAVSLKHKLLDDPNTTGEGYLWILEQLINDASKTALSIFSFWQKKQDHFHPFPNRHWTFLKKLLERCLIENNSPSAFTCFLTLSHLSSDEQKKEIDSFGYQVLEGLISKDALDKAKEGMKRFCIEKENLAKLCLKIIDQWKLKGNSPRACQEMICFEEELPCGMKVCFSQKWEELFLQLTASSLEIFQLKETMLNYALKRGLLSVEKEINHLFELFNWLREKNCSYSYLLNYFEQLLSRVLVLDQEKMTHEIVLSYIQLFECMIPQVNARKNKTTISSSLLERFFFCLIVKPESRISLRLANLIYIQQLSMDKKETNLFFWFSVILNLLEEKKKIQIIDPLIVFAKKSGFFEVPGLDGEREKIFSLYLEQLFTQRQYPAAEVFYSEFKDLLLKQENPFVLFQSAYQIVDGYVSSNLFKEALFFLEKEKNLFLSSGDFLYEKTREILLVWNIKDSVEYIEVLTKLTFLKEGVFLWLRPSLHVAIHSAIQEGSRKKLSLALKLIQHYPVYFQESSILMDLASALYKKRENIKLFEILKGVEKQKDFWRDSYERLILWVMVLENGHELQGLEFIELIKGEPFFSKQYFWRELLLNFYLISRVLDLSLTIKDIEKKKEYFLLAFVRRNKLFKRNLNHFSVYKNSNIFEQKNFAGSLLELYNKKTLEDFEISQSKKEILFLENAIDLQLKKHLEQFKDMNFQNAVIEHAKIKFKESPKEFLLAEIANNLAKTRKLRASLKNRIVFEISSSNYLANFAIVVNIIAVAIILVYLVTWREEMESENYRQLGKKLLKTKLDCST